MSDPTSRILVQQRIRNRQIEWLEMVDGDDDDPWVFGLGSLVNLWFDVNPDVPGRAHYPPPVHTPGEAAALVAVGHAMNALCDATPWSIDDDAALRALPEWTRVLVASRFALAVMSQRGRLPED